MNILGEWRTWRDIGFRALATAYQAFVAVVLAGIASDQIGDIALWQKASVAGLAAVLTFGQRIAQRILASPDPLAGPLTIDRPLDGD